MTPDHDDGRGVSRRKILECMTWAGTGVLWTIAGGVPRSMGIIGEAMAAEPSGLTFLQISDSHVGFDKPANPNALGTLEEAVNKIRTMPVKPSFIIHTGDITHLSKPSEFDDADRNEQNDGNRDRRFNQCVPAFVAKSHVHIDLVSHPISAAIRLPTAMAGP